MCKEWLSFPEFGHLFHWVFEHGGGVREFSSFSHLVRSMITREHMAGLWSQGILDTSTLALALTPQVWYQKSVDSGRLVGCWELGSWCKNHLFSARKKTQTHPLLWFEGSGEAWGEVTSQSKTLDLETLPSSLCCWVPSQSIVHQMGCDMTVYCPDQATHRLVSCGKSSAVSSEQGKHVHEFLEQMMSYE